MARHRRDGWKLAVVMASSVALWAGMMGPAYALTANQCIADVGQTVAFTDILAQTPPYPTLSTTGPNTCMNVPSEGMVALRLPAAGKSIDDVAAVNDMSGYRWGFVNARGELAIPPRFRNVGNFHHGRAKASDGKHWGYIDTRGKWVIAPQYDQVWDFKPGGVALTRKGENWQIIDRSGKSLGVNLGHPVSWATIGSGTPISVEVAYKPYYITRDGDLRGVDDASKSKTAEDVSPVKPYGNDGWMVAYQQGRMGIVDARSNWVIPPKYASVVPPYGDGTLGGARLWARDAFLLQRQDGHWKRRKVKDFRRAGGLWVAVQDKNKYIVLNANGKQLAKLNGKAAFRMQRIGNFLIDASGPKTRVMGPWFDQPITLGSGATVGKPLSNNLIAIVDEGVVNHLITDQGHTIKAPWVKNVAKAHAKGKTIWLDDDNDKLLNIIGADGKPQLSPTVMKKLADYRVKPLSGTPTDTDAPDAIAGLVSVDPKCDCDAKGAGFLMADGALQLHADWQDVHKLRGTTDASGPRFVFGTTDGVGMTDAHGNVLVPAQYTRIGKFHGDYALVEGADKARIVDLSGQFHEVPTGVDVALLGAGMARYAAEPDGLVGLFDIKAQTRVTPPQFKTIDDFVRGSAVAVSKPDGTGVIGTDGQWIVPPDYAAVTALNGAVWKVTLPADTDASAKTQYVLVNAQGEKLMGPSTNMSADMRDDGRVEVTVGHGRHEVVSLFGLAGKLLVDGHAAHFSDVGPLVKVQMKRTIGYLGADHEWMIKPHPETDLPLGAPGRRLQAVDGRTRIVNGKGKTVATLPKAAWYRPDHSDWLLGRVSGGDGQKTLYYDFDGRHKLTVKGFSGPFHNGLALWDPGHDQPIQWIDKQGQPVAHGTYEDLGLPADNGLAVAGNNGRYGYVNKAGKYIIPPVYEHVSNFHEGLAVVANRYRAMLLDTAGQPVARVTTKCRVRVLYGPDNKRIWPQELPQGCQQ